MQKEKGIFPPQRDPAKGGITLLAGIIIIIVVAVILFGGVFAYQYFSKFQIPNSNIQPNSKSQNSNTETAQPSITITSPKGEEIWKLGESNNITWNATDLLSSDEIEIDLIVPSAIAKTSGTYANVIVARAPNSGSFSWTIPNYIIPGNGYLIKISDNTAVVEAKSKNFNITSQLSANENTINNINPVSGPKGTVIEIKGTGLSGFEGDLGVYFERSDGKKVLLFDEVSYKKTGGKLIKVKVIEPCQFGEKIVGRYSGIESICDYVELTPGIYKVYAEPWGKRTNIVNFEITK